MTRLLQLVIADDPSSWRALGLQGILDEAGRWHCGAGPVTITVDPTEARPPEGIVAWGLDREVVPAPDLGVRFHEWRSIDGHVDPRLVGVDHVVLMTSSLDRTCSLVEQHLEAPLKRVREVAGGVRQGFHRLGDVIVEVVERPDLPEGPAHCWGLVLTVADLDAMVQPWSDDVVGTVRPAVQPGRRIASLRRGAGLATAVALMTPTGSVDSPG